MRVLSTTRTTKLLAVLEGTGDVAVKGGEAAFVLADLLGVDPDEGAVVGGAEVEEGAGVGFGGWSKSFSYQMGPS